MFVPQQSTRYSCAFMHVFLTGAFVSSKARHAGA